MGHTELTSKTGGLFADVKKELTLFKEHHCFFSHSAHIFLAHMPTTCGRCWEEKGNLQVPSRV